MSPVDTDSLTQNHDKIRHSFTEKKGKYTKNVFFSDFYVKYASLWDCLAEKHISYPYFLPYQGNFLWKIGIRFSLILNIKLITSKKAIYVTPAGKQMPHPRASRTESKFSKWLVVGRGRITVNKFKKRLSWIFQNDAAIMFCNFAVEKNRTFYWKKHFCVL